MVRRLEPTGLPRQRDGISCGPSVAVMAGVLLNSETGAPVQPWFDSEQVRVHRAVNVVWPRVLGTTPAGMARALTEQSVSRGVRYRWRLAVRRDNLVDVRAALSDGWPVAMLVGSLVPRHWVLLTEIDGSTISCYEPSSGRLLSLPGDAIREGCLEGVGFPRPFAFVLPTGARRGWLPRSPAIRPTPAE